MNKIFFHLCVKIRELAKRETGQDMVEYALVVALIAFGATAGMGKLATGINAAFFSTANRLDPPKDVLAITANPFPSFCHLAEPECPKWMVCSRCIFPQKSPHEHGKPNRLFSKTQKRKNYKSKWFTTHLIQRGICRKSTCWVLNEF